MNDKQRQNKESPQKNEYEVIKRLIEEHQLTDVPVNLFADERRTSTCNKVFSSVSKFFAHLRIHCNEKPYMCPVAGCGLGFSQKGNLRQHLERVHLIHEIYD